MMRIIQKLFCLLCCVVIFGPPVFASDKTYTCTAVDQKASLGVNAASAVSITTGSKTCSFSVDGSSVDGNASRKFFVAMNLFFDGRFDNMGNFGSDSDSLKDLILAVPLAQNGGNIRDFDNQFQGTLSDLGSCLAAFREGGDRSFDSQGISCMTVDSNSGQIGRFPIAIESERDSRSRILVIAVDFNSGFGSQGTLLFIPEELMDAGRRGFRYNVQ